MESAPMKTLPFWKVMIEPSFLSDLAVRSLRLSLSQHALAADISCLHTPNIADGLWVALSQVRPCSNGAIQTSIALALAPSIPEPGSPTNS